MSLFSPTGLYFPEESDLMNSILSDCNISQENWGTGDFCLLILLSPAFLPVKVIFQVILLLLVILNEH